MQSTFVNITTDVCWYSGHFTQLSILCGAIGRTLFAQIIFIKLPPLAHSSTTATINPGQLELHLVGALTVLSGEGGVTVALATIQTPPPVLGGDEVGLAHAVVTRVSVDTPASVTRVLTTCLTLVLVNTFVFIVHHRSIGTDAVKRSYIVLTLASITEAGNGLTLIDIHALASVNILQEPSITLQLVRTLFTRMTPPLANGGTTELLGADHAL